MIYLLSPKSKVDTVHLPMITFALCETSLDVEKYDLLMFTSKQAVLSAEAINPKWKEIPCLAIGKATAHQIKILGGTVAYHPSSFYAERLSHDIVEKFKDKKLLYLRPKKVSFDSKSFLQREGIVLQEQIIYETFCLKYTAKDIPVDNAIIIFTSPSTIQCFLKNFDWKKSYTAVVIGNATRVHLPVNACYEVADTALISSCIEKAKQILISNRL